MAAALVCAAVAIAVLHPATDGRGVADRGVTATTQVATTTRPTTTTTVPPTTTIDPGSLPQTNAFPTTNSPQFQTEMAALWQGIVSGSSATAEQAFFPERAYLQLKAIGDPASDFTNRLLADFTLDLLAAHSLLGPDPGAANLVSVNVPEQYGHWIPPGVCDNRIGYYEVANSRVVYQEDGETQSFGIASLISWRGEWYIVHLGAILRSSPEGVVDDPETGPGGSADSTTC